MLHPLQQRVWDVECRVRRLTLACGAARFLAAALAIVAGTGLLDYFLRPRDGGVRLILSLAVLLGVAWACWRFLAPVLGRHRSLIHSAARIERHFPVLGERLSSAIAFLAQSPDDPTAGSVVLRRAVVAETEALAVDLDFQAAVEPKPARRALWLAGTVLLATVLTAAAAPRHVSIAARRLAIPWGHDHWPARHQLVIVRGAETIAVGDDFEIEVADRSGELPEEVFLQIRREQEGRRGVETRPMKRIGDRMVFRLDNVSASLEYRAFGGDDDSMGWRLLSVVTPPKIVELTVEVTPPAYTGRPRETIGRVARVLAGSQIALRGKVDRPIRSAALKREDGQKLPVQFAVAGGGLAFHAPADSAKKWIVEKSETLWFDLAGEQPLPGVRDARLELQVLPDAPPTLSWELPSDHALVTPRALVPIKCLVKDDLAIRRVELRYLRPDASDAGEQVVELYRGPDKPQPPAPLAAGAGGQTLALDTSWDLAAIPALQPGAVLAVRIVAEDYRPQQSAATVRRLTIIAEEELENRVVQRQSSVLAQLGEALRLARAAREQTAALEIRLRETGTLTPQDISHLQSAELNQRQVQRLLSDPADGVQAQIAALLEELRFNRVASQAAAERMQELLEKVRQIEREQLAAIAHELNAALKAARAAVGQEASSCGPPPEEVSQGLARAGAGQEQVIETLESLLGNLTQWDSFSRLAREVAQLRSEEERLADETEKLRLELATSATPQSAALRAESRRLAQRQRDIARRFDKLQSRMQEMLGRVDQEDPLVAATLAEAIDASRRLAIAGKMRAAASELQEVQPGTAQRTQREVIQGLEELTDLLSRRRDAELARQTQSLKAAAGALAGILKRHRALRGQVETAAVETDSQQRSRKVQRLQQPGEQLAQEVKELSRRLERLQARRAAEAGAQAGDALAQTGQAAAGADLAEVQRQADTAQDLLEETAQQLMQQIHQAEQDLLREQLARFEQHVQGLLARQQNILRETTRLEEFRPQQQGKLTLPQAATLRGIASEQRLLAEEARQLGTTIPAAKAFVFSLEGIEREMALAAGELQRGLTGPSAKEPQEAALARLGQLLEALQPEQSPPPQQDEQPPMAGEGQRPPSLHSLAELKLLKLMQEEVARQTALLEEARQSNGQLTEAQMQRLQSLARQQGKLADMVLDMVNAAAEKPADELLELLERPENEGKAGDKKKEKQQSLEEALLRDLEPKP
jgi:hypothetical protein